MGLFCIVLSITLVQIPAVILRYIPFSKLVTQKQKKFLIYCYTIAFLFQNIFLFIIIFKKCIIINPLLYKIAIIAGSSMYFFINCLIIKRMFYKHIFIYGMQAIYSLFLHSFSAIILSTYSRNISQGKQFIIQTFTYLILFTVTLCLLWKVIKNSFILNIYSNNKYYWNIIWLIPFLLFFSNSMVTMDANWINTWLQLISRILLGCSIFVIWKCVNLDFKELEKMQSLESTNKFLHINMEAIQHQAENIKENDEKIRILRHDMRHNVQMLSSLIKTGNFDSALKILADLNDTLESTKSIVFCKNPVINSSLLEAVSK